MTATLILWSHALAALLFAGLAVRAREPGAQRLPRAELIAALVLTALWALAVAGIGPAEITTRIAESGRNLGWLALLYALHRTRVGAAGRVGLLAVYGAVAGLIAATMVLHLAAGVAGGGPRASIEALALVFRMLATVTALVLVQNLYSAADAQSAPGTRAIALAPAVLWLIDLNLFAVVYLTGSWPAALVALRGLGAALLAAPVAIALSPRLPGPLQPSRAVVHQALILAGAGLYVALLAAASQALDSLGGAHARALQTAFVLGSATAILTLVSSPWLRAWARVKLAKHLFRHRYDYRAEWMRFTGTMGLPEGAAPLDERIIRAVADLTDSPAGLLLVPTERGFEPGAAWNWDRALLPDDAAPALLEGDRIVEIDAVRAEGADGRDALPAWVLADDAAWVLVPLPHFDRLVGAILLARPPLSRALDWEDFDLLKVAGRQVASYLAEAHARDALAEAQRFDEFNRRFAFIMHDIKNLVSQLTLVARNAERHADNPDFRADMVATLQSSAVRMTDLLARLSQANAEPLAEPVAALDAAAVVRRVAGQFARRHPVRAHAPHAVAAIASPARLEQLLGHLVLNAIEASPPAAPVEISVHAGAAEVAIDVVDRGRGMSAAFVRDKLFKPFVSSKPGGFGIGAYEARGLARAMGGRIEVLSVEGRGSRFRLVLAAAQPSQPALEVAA